MANQDKGSCSFCGKSRKKMTPLPSGGYSCDRCSERLDRVALLIGVALDEEQKSPIPSMDSALRVLHGIDLAIVAAAPNIQEVPEAIVFLTRAANEVLDYLRDHYASANSTASIVVDARRSPEAEPKAT